MARQLVDSGQATPEQLRQISDGWRRWAEAEDGWFMVPHGEIIYRKPEARR